MCETLATILTTALGVKGKQSKIKIGITPRRSTKEIKRCVVLRAFTRCIYFKCASWRSDQNTIKLPQTVPSHASMVPMINP